MVNNGISLSRIFGACATPSLKADENKWRFRGDVWLEDTRFLEDVGFFEETRSRSRKTLRNLLWFVFVVARLTCGICKWFPIIQYVKAEYLHNWMSRLSPKRCHVACWTPVFDSQVIASQTPRLLPYPLPLEKTWTGKTGFCLKTLSGCHSSTRKRPNNNNNNKKKTKGRPRRSLPRNQGQFVNQVSVRDIVLLVVSTKCLNLGVFNVHVTPWQTCFSLPKNYPLAKAGKKEETY